MLKSEAGLVPELGKWIQLQSFLAKNLSNLASPMLAGNP